MSQQMSSPTVTRDCDVIEFVNYALRRKIMFSHMTVQSIRFETFIPVLRQDLGINDYYGYAALLQPGVSKELPTALNYEKHTYAQMITSQFLSIIKSMVNKFSHRYHVFSANHQKPECQRKLDFGEEPPLKKQKITPMEQLQHEQLLRVQTHTIYGRHTPTCMIQLNTILNTYGKFHGSIVDMNNMALNYYIDILENSGVSEGIVTPWHYNPVNTQPRGYIAPLISYSLKTLLGPVFVQGDIKCQHCEFRLKNDAPTADMPVTIDPVWPTSPTLKLIPCDSLFGI